MFEIGKLDMSCQLVTNYKAHNKKHANMAISHPKIDQAFSDQYFVIQKTKQVPVIRKAPSTEKTQSQTQRSCPKNASK